MSKTSDERAKRLADALRANLRKRKERGAPSLPDAPPETPKPSGTHS